MSDQDALEGILASLYDAMLDDSRWPAASALVLGHSDVRTTERYTLGHVPEGMRSATSRSRSTSALRAHGPCAGKGCGRRRRVREAPRRFERTGSRGEPGVRSRKLAQRVAKAGS